MILNDKLKLYSFSSILKQDYKKPMEIWVARIEWIQSIDEDFHCILEQLFCEEVIE